MEIARQQEVTIAGLRAAVLDAFADAEPPSITWMMHPMVNGLTASGCPSPEARLVELIFGHRRWQDLQLAAFDWGDEFVLGPDTSARVARSILDLLSNSGICYYVPSLMLIVLAEGKAAALLFFWLLDQLDPDWVGPDQVEAAFGQWNKAKVSITLRFLDWAYGEFCMRSYGLQSYDGQAESVRTFWQDRLRRADFSPTAT